MNLAEILIKESRYTDAETLARQGYEAQLRTLGAAHPETVNSLRTLGKALAHLHRYEEAENMIRATIGREDKSNQQENRWAMWYALACVAVAADRSGDAIGFLHQAVDRGYNDGDGLLGEDDLKRLRNDRRFQQILAQIKKRHTAA